jgi:hypothetical protein
MISHIVLFKPKPTLGQAERLAIVEHLKTAIASCPTVRRCRAGRRVLHGLPGYEQLMAENPAHAGVGGIGDLFATAASAALAYDYELVDLENADRLL